MDWVNKIYKGDYYDTKARILKGEFDFCEKDVFGESILHYVLLLLSFNLGSTKKDLLEFTEFLIEECPEQLINEKDKRGDTPLHLVAGMKDTSLAKHLMEKLMTRGADVNVVNGYGETPAQIVEKIKANTINDYDKLISLLMNDKSK